MEINIKLKEIIKLKIKPNFAALAREYGCDYRTVKAKYERELRKEKDCFVDEYKETIDNKLTSS